MSVPRPVRSKKMLPWVVLGFFALLAIGFIVGKMAIDSYLRSERFRSFVGRKTGETLKAEVQVQPFQFSGSTIYTDGIEAQGSTASSFASLKADQTRIEVSARRFFEHVWQVDQVDVQRAELHLDGPRGDIPPPPAALDAAAREEHPSSAFLPNRVEISAATIHDALLTWSGGSVSKLGLEVTNYEGGWNIAGHGGQIKNDPLPTVDIDSLKLRYKEPSLFVQSAVLREGSGGLNVVGEVRLNDNFDLQAKIQQIAVSPLLPSDWRAKLSGNLSGDVRAKGSLPLKETPALSGSVQLSDGILEALPVLNQIATFTRTAQFRRLSLSKASGDFTRNGEHLAVTNLILESSTLIRMEGAFTVDHDIIDGTFQVGVSPSSLQWLPGSQERVFTVSRNGYLWAPMRLTGPVASPTEDLTPRLVAAAAGSVVDTAKNLLNSATQAAPAAQGAVDTLKEAADKARGLLFGK